MKNKDKTWIEIEDEEVLVKRVVKEYVDEYGRLVKVARWEKLTKPISFGSMVEPKNTEVIAIKSQSTKNFLDNIRERLGK